MSNPEFRRNLWIEFTSARVTVGGVLTGLLLACAIAVDFALRVQGQPFRPVITEHVAYWLFVLIALLWGGNRASGAVLREVRGKTWDAQRMSTLHPWTMTWGKLFGAPALAWLVAFACAAAFAAAAMFERPPGAVLRTVAELIGYALLCHAAGLLVSLARLSGRPGDRGGTTTVAHFVGLVLAILLAAYIYWGLDGEYRWFGLDIGQGALTLMTVWLFALWAVVGVYRRMRRELQMRGTPWPWPLFMITLVVYAEGLIYGRNQPQAALMLPTALCTVMTWMLLVIEAKDPLALRQGLGWLRRGRLGPAVQLVPLWLVTYIIFGLVVAGSIVLALSGTDRLQRWNLPGSPTVSTVMALVATALFVTRDVFIVQTLSLSRDGAMAGAYFGIVWFVLYLGVPAVIVAGQRPDLLGLVLPTGQGGWEIGLLPAAVQALLALALFAWRWRGFWRENAATAPAR